MVQRQTRIESLVTDPHISWALVYDKHSMSDSREIRDFTVNGDRENGYPYIKDEIRTTYIKKSIVDGLRS